jgi:hypothetical protein
MATKRPSTKKPTVKGKKRPTVRPKKPAAPKSADVSKMISDLIKRNTKALKKLARL